MRKFGKSPMIKFAAGLCGLLILGAGAGYWFFFVDGFDDLAAEPCDGLVSRGAVRSVLPDTREVEVGGGSGPFEKSNFRQSCYFMTQGRESTLYIVVRTTLYAFDDHRGDVKWKENGRRYERKADGTLVISQPGQADAVLPCPVKEVRLNAVGASVETDGELRADGKDLRMGLEGIAIKAARQVKEKLKCSSPR